MPAIPPFYFYHHISSLLNTHSIVMRISIASVSHLNTYHHPHHITCAQLCCALCSSIYTSLSLVDTYMRCCHRNMNLMCHLLDRRSVVYSTSLGWYRCTIVYVYDVMYAAYHDFSIPSPSSMLILSLHRRCPPSLSLIDTHTLLAVILRLTNGHSIRLVTVW